jgi:hypothetical protein
VRHAVLGERVSSPIFAVKQRICKEFRKISMVLTARVLRKTPIPERLGFHFPVDPNRESIRPEQSKVSAVQGGRCETRCAVSMPTGFGSGDRRDTSAVEGLSRWRSWRPYPGGAARGKRVHRYREIPVTTSAR